MDFYDESLVTDERIRKYTSVFDLPGSYDSHIAVAKQVVPVNHNSIIEKIRTISIPTLIIWGEQDPVIPVAHAHRLHREIPNSRLEIIPECGHLPHEEKSQLTTEFIRQFFA